MNPGNGLHQPPITIAKTNSVDIFHSAYIRAAIFGDRNTAIVSKLARHAANPEQFIVNMLIGVAMNFIQLIKHL